MIELIDAPVATLTPTMTRDSFEAEIPAGYVAGIGRLLPVARPAGE
jgi:hypothetical protein